MERSRDRYRDSSRSRSRDRYYDRRDSRDRSRSRSRERYNDRRGSRDYDRKDFGDRRDKENRAFANYGVSRDDRGDDRRDDRRGGDHYGKRGRSPPPIVPQNDDLLPQKKDDPRVNANGEKEGGKAIKAKGGGRNTESFDPRSTLVRPSMRVVVGPNRPEYNKKLKHDDVVIVPEFFCAEDDWSLYYKLVEEMRQVQSADNSNPDKKGSEWISWHEGAHLISKNPKGSATYNEIQEKISRYFGIENDKVGTRFNWYRDSSDWKPFHHDSAAFNPQRAKNQNITVGVSFGATRELSFLHAKTGDRIYFPQTNGMLFSFGRDVNINFKHGVNALAPEEQDGKGRISIILWGLAPNVIDEKNSPPVLTDNTRGGGHNMHAGRGGGGGGRDKCRDFQRGRCSHGDRCRFAHD